MPSMAMTLGYGDKIAAGLDALTGRSPDYASALNAERAQSARAMAQSRRGVGTAEQIAGMALPAGAIGRGAAALGEAASALPFGLGRLAASPLAQASATGATVGGINAAGNDQPVAPNAVLGALAGAGGNALARPVARVLAGPAAAVAAPSTQAVKDTAQAAYNDAFQPGQIVAPESLQRLSAAVRQTMADNAYHPALHPGGAAVIDGLSALPTPGASAAGAGPQNAGATLQGLDTLRRMAGQMGQNGQNPSAGRIGALVQGNIDQFINGLGPADIVGASNPADSAAALARARQAYTTYSKANDLDETVAAARNRAEQAQIPNANLDPTLRNAVARLRDSRTNWSPDELAALNEAAKGSPTQKAVRIVGALLSGNAAHVAGGGLGFAVGGPVGAGLGALGSAAPSFVAKRAAAGMTESAINRLGNIIRSGGGAPTTLAPMGTASLRRLWRRCSWAAGSMPLSRRSHIRQALGRLSLNSTEIADLRRTEPPRRYAADGPPAGGPSPSIRQGISTIDGALVSQWSIDVRARPSRSLTTTKTGSPNAATALRCSVATSRLPSFCVNRIMNLATASRFISSHPGPSVHIAASNALPIVNRASGEKTIPSPK